MDNSKQKNQSALQNILNKIVPATEQKNKVLNYRTNLVFYTDSKDKLNISGR